MIIENQAIARALTQKILEAINVAMSETTQIAVTTCIDSGDIDRIQQSASASRFRTQIDLLNKTVEHKIDRKLIDNPAYRELQRWHIEQVHQRQDSLIENLASLEMMRHLALKQNCT